MKHYGCPKCGQVMENDFGFCPNCGEAVLIIDGDIYSERQYNTFKNNEEKLKNQRYEIRSKQMKLNNLEKQVSEYDETLENLWKKVSDLNRDISKRESNQKNKQKSPDPVINTDKNENTVKPSDNKNEDTIKPSDNNQTKKININTASIDEIKTLPNINLIQAKKIIQMREDGNYVESFDDLTSKLNLKPYQLSEIKNLVVIDEVVNDNDGGRFIDL